MVKNLRGRIERAYDPGVEDVRVEYGEPVAWGDDHGKWPLRRWRSQAPGHPGDIVDVTVGRLGAGWYVERGPHPSWPPACRRYPLRAQADDVARRVMADTGRATWVEAPVALPHDVWIASLTAPPDSDRCPMCKGTGRR